MNVSRVTDQNPSWVGLREMDEQEEESLIDSLGRHTVTTVPVASPLGASKT